MVWMWHSGGYASVYDLSHVNELVWCFSRLTHFTALVMLLLMTDGTPIN